MGACGGAGEYPQGLAVQRRAFSPAPQCVEHPTASGAQGNPFKAERVQKMLAVRFRCRRQRRRGCRHRHPPTDSETAGRRYRSRYRYRLRQRPRQRKRQRTMNRGQHGGCYSRPVAVIPAAARRRAGIQCLNKVNEFGYGPSLGRRRLPAVETGLQRIVDQWLRPRPAPFNSVYLAF